MVARIRAIYYRILAVYNLEFLPLGCKCVCTAICRLASLGESGKLNGYVILFNHVEFGRIFNLRLVRCGKVNLAFNHRIGEITLTVGSNDYRISARLGYVDARRSRSLREFSVVCVEVKSLFVGIVGSCRLVLLLCIGINRNLLVVGGSRYVISPLLTLAVIGHVVAVGTNL